MAPGNPSDGASAVALVSIVNQRGLHARAAAKFVKLAGTFDAKVTVVKGDLEVSGSSILGLMMLVAGPGSDLELRAVGPAADRAVSALAELVANKFDEDS